MAVESERSESSGNLLRLASLAAALGCILGYDAVGRLYYESFRVPQGYGMYHLLPEELAHLALFTLFGLAAAAFLFVAIRETVLCERALGAVEALSRRPWTTAVLVAVLVTLTCGFVSGSILGHAAITDDEHAYQFIAATLRTGSLTARSPGVDLDYYREQFVVLTEKTRYGKYPIGHPLVLAAAQALGFERWALPTIAGLLALPLTWIGLRLFGPAASVVALALLASSPQVLLTGATLLSQPTCALALLVGVACLLAADEAAKPTRWLAASGAALGYGVLVRPLPGVLFVVAAMVWLAVRRRPGRRFGKLAWASFLIPVAIAGLLILVVNRIQAGGALMSGYQAFHTPGEGAASLTKSLAGDATSRTMAVAATVLRLNAWFLGWPLSLLPLLLARRVPRAGLLWGLVVAALAYRLVAPKAGVGGVGPLYMFEVAPILCLLGADGLVRLARPGGFRGLVLHRGGLAALGLSGALVSLTMFLPVKLEDLGRMGRAQLALPRLLAQRDVHNAIVFHQGAVPLGLSWAYYPRCNAPALDDDVLFVRFAPGSVEENLAFWKRRFPSRSAWYFGYSEGRPGLLPLEALEMSPPPQGAPGTPAPSARP